MDDIFSSLIVFEVYGGETSDKELYSFAISFGFAAAADANATFNPDV
jgi:hypothetical protein